MEFPELKEFFSAEEEERMQKEREYLLHGPGKIERILNEEMEKLAEHMEAKITQQDEEFLSKLGTKK